jgi:glycerophosphoryl diester phosphodiesterase
MSFNKYALTALCSVPIVFFASRYFVVKYPTLLHKKKNIGILGHQNLIGHRGSRLEGLPENSLAAFKDAAKTAHILELDVWLTKDGEVVVHHDDTLHRMTAGRVAERVTDLHLHQLPKLVPPEKQDHRVHSGEYCPDDCHCIPTLERLLESLSDDTHLIVEFKQDSDELIQKVHTLLTRFGRVQGRKDYWFSLREGLNKKLRAYDPNIPRITSVLGSARILLLHLVGLLPFLPIEEDAYGTDISHVSCRVVL